MHCSMFAALLYLCPIALLPIALLPLLSYHVFHTFYMFKWILVDLGWRIMLNREDRVHHVVYLRSFSFDRPNPESLLQECPARWV